MKLLRRKTAYHSQAIGQRMRCNEPLAEEKSNVTHFLFVMGCNVIRLPARKGAPM